MFAHEPVWVLLSSFSSGSVSLLESIVLRYASEALKLFFTTRAFLSNPLYGK